MSVGEELMLRRSCGTGDEELINAGCRTAVPLHCWQLEWLGAVPGRLNTLGPNPASSALHRRCEETFVDVSKNQTDFRNFHSCRYFQEEK